MTTENLWGDLPKPESLKSPKKLLQEQAELLSQMTDDHLRGHVNTETTEGRIIHELEIIAPYINNYTVTVLRIVHGAVIYPAEVIQTIAPSRALLCNDFNTLRDGLKILLQSGETKKLISSLLTQSREA